MAKVGEFNSTLAEALRVLDKPDRSGTPELRKALALVHGSGVFRPGDLETRFAGSTHFSVHPETGKLMLTDVARTQPQESWVAVAGIASAKHIREDDVVLNSALQPWHVVGTKKRSSSGSAGMVRSAENPRQKVAAMVASPVIRRSTLATVEHTKRGRDPFDSYGNAAQSLQVTAVQKELTMAGQFRDDLEVRDTDRVYEVQGTEDGAFVRMTQLLGSYARKLSIQNDERRDRVATVQSVLVTRQTLFATNPEWGDLLFDADDLEAEGFVPLSSDTTQEVTSFVDAGDDIVVPLSSSLHATQDWRVINREMY